MHLLYCINGDVVAIHDDSQPPVDPSQYGTGTRVIPWSQPLGNLQYDTSQAHYLPDGVTFDPAWPLPPYLEPNETPSILIAYSAQMRWQTVTNGITYNTIPVNSARLSQTLIGNLAAYAATVAPTTAIDFTQDGVHYAITAQDAINMNNQLNSFIQQCRTVEASCIADLNGATPTILTYADVDAKFSGLRAMNVKK